MASTSIEFDPARLSRVIGLGYEAAFSSSAWRALADDIAAASGSRMALIQYIEDEHPEQSFLVCGGLGDDFKEAFAETSWLSEDDRFWTAIRSKPAGTVRLGHEIVSPADMHRSPAYLRVALPWRLEHFLISAVATGNGQSAYLSLGRTRDQPPFLEGDKALFSQTVVAHLRRSLDLHRELAMTREYNGALGAVVDLTPYGVVVFDMRGRPVVVNKQAARIFGASEGLTMINGRLHAADPAAHARLESALSMAIHGALGAMTAPPDPVIVPRKDHTHPYQVVFSQANSGDSVGGFPSGPAVVTLIHDRWLAGSRYIPAMLRSTYELTRAEIRLCQSLLGGDSLPEAARNLGISRNTAKTHLGRVFDKTGVRSQAALLRLLAVGRRAS